MIQKPPTGSEKHTEMQSEATVGVKSVSFGLVKTLRGLLPGISSEPYQFSSEQGAESATGNQPMNSTNLTGNWISTDTPNLDVAASIPFGKKTPSGKVKISDAPKDPSLSSRNGLPSWQQLLENPFLSPEGCTPTSVDFPESTTDEPPASPS